MDDFAHVTVAELFSGEGDMLAAARAMNWHETAFGPVSGWPAELRTVANICMSSSFQIAIAWGPELRYLYNDAAIPIFGDKHPWALGRRVADVWPEAWPTIGPLLESVLATGMATGDQDLLLLLDRRGFMEECYFTFSYSAIRSSCGAVAGVFVTTMETSERVLGERRRRVLADLATQATKRFSGEDPLELVRAVLECHPFDPALVALFLPNQDETLSLAFATGAGAASAPAADLAGFARACWSAGTASIVDPAIPVRCKDGVPSTVREMLALPLRRTPGELPIAVVLMSASPLQSLDRANRAFLDSVAEHILDALAASTALAADRQRRMAMAALDSSTAQFFANAIRDLPASMKLMTGPLDALLMADGQALPAPVHNQLRKVHANARRLNKLIDSLSDFAHAEARRLSVPPEPVDPIALATGIVEAFRVASDSANPEQMPHSARPGLLHERLTTRERDILALIGAGLQVKQVAAALSISASSVNTYRHRIFQKTGLRSNAALIRYSLQQGLVK